MRILLVNETARCHTGGANRLVVESLGLLAAAGHSVALAYTDAGASEVTCPVWRLDEPPQGLAGGRALDQVLREFKPDVAQVHWGLPPDLTGVLMKRVPTCQFIHDQSWFCSGGDRMGRRYRPCHRPHGVGCLFWHYAQGCGGKSLSGNRERWQLAQARARLVPGHHARFQVASAFMRRGLLENGYPAAQIDVIPLFALPAQATGGAEPGLLLAPARLVRGKGMDLAVGALAHLPPVRWRLAVAGAGAQRGELEATARRLGVAERVQFLGELPPAELHHWYARAAVVVHPAVRPEPFGLVGIEAMAQGRPVVAFAGGGTEEWLVDGETGLVIQERSPRALAQGLAALLSDPDRARAMGQAGRRRWEEFRAERFLERVLASFERCRAAWG